MGQAATTASCGSTHSTTSSTHCATCGSTRHDLLPLRLQCRVFQLGKGMANRQETVLLPNSQQRMRGPAPCSTWPSGNNLFAPRLQCRLPRLLPLLAEAVVGGETRLVLPAYATRVSHDSRSQVSTFLARPRAGMMCRFDAQLHGDMMHEDALVASVCIVLSHSNSSRLERLKWADMMPSCME